MPIKRVSFSSEIMTRTFIIIDDERTLVKNEDVGRSSVKLSGKTNLELLNGEYHSKMYKSIRKSISRSLLDEIPDFDYDFGEDDPRSEDEIREFEELRRNTAMYQMGQLDYENSC